MDGTKGKQDSIGNEWMAFEIDGMMDWLPSVMGCHTAKLAPNFD